VPSIWYENFPRTIVEAYAEGTPVVASRLGALSELVAEGRFGLLFEPGNPTDLVDKLMACLVDPARTLSMGENARVHFAQHLSPSANYEVLRQIYDEAIWLRHGGISNDSRVFVRN
jgi:glycosyltransferase involved in cell wall biosynthesis